MRSRTLDILRFVAVLLVTVSHLTPCPENVNRVLAVITYHWKLGGGVGVDLFFVLSGFLVSGLLFKEHQRYGVLSVKNFLLRRGLKIYPAFYAMIAATLAFRWWQGKDLPLGNVLRELVFLQNYSPGLHGHTWSLAVEEHFYLSLPFVLLLGLKRKWSRNPDDAFAWLPKFFLCVATFCLGMRIYQSATLPFYTNFTHHWPTHLRLDSLLFGVLISYYYHYRPEVLKAFTRRHRWWLGPAGAGLLLLPFFVDSAQSLWMPNIGATLLYLGGGMLLCSVLYSEPAPNLFINLLSFIGARSYSIYLWHTSAITWFAAGAKSLAPAGLSWYAYAVVGVVGAFAVGVLTAQIVELPVLKLRDRFFPSRSQPSATSKTPTSATL